ncbi:MAG: hypothetical protein WD052_01325 [Bacteroidales bacterium]
MKIIYIILITSFICLGCQNELISQSKHHSFNGGVEIGSGICTVIDFYSYNNGPAIPMHFGIFTYRYLKNEDYFELDLMLSKRGDHYEYKLNNYIEGHGLTLFYFDFRTSYNKRILLTKKYNSYVSFGIANAILALDPTNFSGSEFEDIWFRNYNLSGYTGLRLHRRNFRWSLIYNLSLISIIKPKYKNLIFEVNKDYKGRIYPMELSLALAYIFE